MYKTTIAIAIAIAIALAHCTLAFLLHSINYQTKNATDPCWTGDGTPDLPCLPGDPETGGGGMYVAHTMAVTAPALEESHTEQTPSAKKIRSNSPY